MAFPKIITEKRGWWIFKYDVDCSDGWEDLGGVGDLQYVEDGVNKIRWQACKLCNSRLHIGRENDEVFLYCPRCFLKANSE